MDDDQFEQQVRGGQFPLNEFTHRAHLRFAFLLLRRLPFLEACITMRDTLKTFGTRAGKPGLYHETITIAFMSVVAERLAAGDEVDCDAFLAANPDLSDRRLLRRYYPPDLLASARARSRFILSEPACQPARAADAASQRV
jgi:hypothetical protein